jgi:hypothetical protein
MDDPARQPRPSKSDQILDLLLDALAERQAARRAEASRAASTTSRAAPKPAVASLTPMQTTPAGGVSSATPTPPSSPPQTSATRRPDPGDAGWTPPPRVPSMGMARILGRFAIVVAVLTVLMNIPVNAYGTSLARIMPDSASLIIRDGLVLKGSGPEIYRLEDNQLRWISSMDAFEHLGLQWRDVHVVEDSFLAGFARGRPIHVLAKCPDSPHIYRLEGGQKRWIKDIPTLLAEGHVWEDVRILSCEYLRRIPDGPSIPEDAGPAPQP